MQDWHQFHRAHIFTKCFWHISHWCQTITSLTSVYILFIYLRLFIKLRHRKTQEWYLSCSFFLSECIIDSWSNLICIAPGQALACNLRLQSDWLGMADDPRLRAAVRCRGGCWFEPRLLLNPGRVPSRAGENFGDFGIKLHHWVWPKRWLHTNFWVSRTSFYHESWVDIRFHLE